MEDAVESGDANKVAELIRQDPGFNVNTQDEYGCTLLHNACSDSKRFADIPLLLAHPDIEINVRDDGGYTPFYYACFLGCALCS